MEEQQGLNISTKSYIAALLIGLGLADVSYAAWFKWTLKFQAATLVISSLLLMLGLAIGY